MLNSRFARRFLLALAALLVGAPVVQAQPRPAGVKGLPQKHDYQKQIRAFMATLTEKDFEPQRGGKFAAAANVDADEQLRSWVLAIDAPRIGAKRSSPSVNLPSAQFTLKFIESPSDQTVMRPWVWAEPLVWLANWKSPSNPYYGSRALKLRAFVHVAQDLMMMHEQQETNKSPIYHRADWFGPRLIMYAYTYEGVKDVLPDAARKAFEAGIKTQVLNVINTWGPKGEETFLDIQPAVAMTILYQSMKDEELKPMMEAYVKKFMAAGEYYHPAGYFPDQGCFDTGFNGLTLYFATWIAARSDWPWAKDSVAQAWKLRGYLMLPEPDAKRVRLSPTHFTFRTSSPVAYDQWNWPFKAVTASYLTDDALCQTPWPTAEELKESSKRSPGGLNAMLAENPRNAKGENAKNEELKSGVWSWSLWPGSPAFPMVNYGHEHYRKGFAAHLADLQKKNSPLFKIPFERPGTFIEQFDTGFLIARMKNYGVVIHTGPVSEFPGKSLLEYPNAPYGLSGGSLSAFWTPTTGSSILGRRGGMSVPGGKATNFDKPEEWRNWPVHAVSGSTAAGKFFTSARIQKPTVSYLVKGDNAIVNVAGDIPAQPLGKEKSLEGKIEYKRTFNVGPDAVRVETSVTSDGVDKLAELYEVIPAFHREESLQEKIVAKIELQSGGSWTSATTAYSEKVTAIRITRFTGAILVQLESPRRVKLSPGETGPGFLTSGVNRNILIDLLENNGQTTALKAARTIRFSITPAK